MNTNYIKSFFALCITLSGLFLVYKFTCNIFWFDEYILVDLYRSFHENTLTFSKLFAQHNEHRIFFPNLLFLGIGECTAWNVRFFMLASQCLYIFLAFWIWNFIKKEYHFSIKTNFPWWLLIPVLTLFNLEHFENFLWGFQLGFALVFVSSVLCLYFLSSFLKYNTKSSFFCSLFFGIVATFSSSQGIAVWFIGIILFFITYLFDLDYQKHSLKERFNIVVKNRFLIIWFLASCLNIGLFFYGYKNSGNIPIKQLLSQPYLPIFCFIFQWGAWGASFTKLLKELIGMSDINWITWAGICISFLFFATTLFICFKSLLENKRIKANLFWIALLFNMFCFTILSSIGRFRFGVESSVASRYYMFFTPIIISTLFILFDIKNNTNRYRKIFKIYISVVFILLISCFVYRLHEGSFRIFSYRNYAIYMLRNHPESFTAKDYYCLHPDTIFVKRELEYMRKQKINLFKEWK